MVDAQPTPSTKFESTEFLLQCMKQRRDVLADLRLLTDSQAEATRSADANLTLGILARKENLLSDLARIDESLKAYHHDDPEQRQWKSAARRQECRQLAEDGERLLKETMRLEQATLIELTGQRDAIAAQLENGTDSVLAHHAYTAGEQLGSSSLDLSNH